MKRKAFIGFCWSGTCRFVFCLLLALSLALAGCGSTSHFRVSAQTHRMDPETQKLAKSTSYGTGFFVNRTGLALTAAHIFRGKIHQTERAYAWWSGSKTGLSAEPVMIDWNMDLALVQVDTRTSVPVRPLCTEVVSGNKAVATGAPEHLVLRKRGVIFGVYVEGTPCDTQEEDGGVGVRCANEKPFIHTSDNRWISSPLDAPAAIIEATINIRAGFSGGSVLHKDGKKACTAGVIIQQYETDHKRTRAIHPGSSNSITRYLLEHAPKFMENFTN